MKAILSEKGQITIPQEIRENLGLKPGQVLDFEARNGLLIGQKQIAGDSLDEVVGLLRNKIDDVDAYLDATRGARPKKGRARS